MLKNKYVCFCSVNRHPHFSETGRFPSNCDLCGSPLSLTRIMSEAEAIANGFLNSNLSSTPRKTDSVDVNDNVTSTPPQPQIASFIQPSNCKQTSASNPTSSPLLVRPQSFVSHPPIASAEASHTRPIPTPIPVQSTIPSLIPKQVRMIPQTPLKSTSVETSQNPINQTETQQITAASALRFDYFGEKIIIPTDGGWLGRSGLGNSWFEGNLLISRKHLKIMPLQSGMLEIGPDNSLNGVYFDVGEGKQQLAKDAVIEVPIGCTIWLYNIPLKLERC